MSVATKPKLATTSLAGCFGCHMSLLDLDDRILELVELVDFDRSPINDIKDFSGPCAIGLVEGACCNEENVRVLRSFRESCEVLVSVGECARTGGIPAMRNPLSLAECLDEAYRNGVTVHNPSEQIPNDSEIPLLLNRVYPIHEVVDVDYHIMGCPPSAETLWCVLSGLLLEKPVELPYELIKYD